MTQHPSDHALDGDERDPSVDARGLPREAARMEGARAAWRAACTFSELCALGVEFLEGRCAYFPAWGAPDTDVETDAIRAPLVELNRHGLLSVASQPAFDGSRADRRILQRAFVVGFAREDLVHRLLRARHVVVRAWFADGTVSAVGEHPDAHRAGPEAMTLEEGIARVLAGRDARAEELDLFAADLGPKACDALRAAAYVSAWDPCFGRTELLWDECVRLAAS